MKVCLLATWQPKRRLKKTPGSPPSRISLALNPIHSTRAAIVLGCLAIGKGGSEGLHCFSSFVAVARKSPRRVRHRERPRRLGWDRGQKNKPILYQMPSLVAWKKKKKKEKVLTPKVQGHHPEMENHPQ